MKLLVINKSTLIFSTKSQDRSNTHPMIRHLKSNWKPLSFGFVVPLIIKCFLFLYIIQNSKHQKFLKASQFIIFLRIYTLLSFLYHLNLLKNMSLARIPSNCHVFYPLSHFVNIRSYLRLNEI